MPKVTKRMSGRAGFDLNRLVSFFLFFVKIYLFIFGCVGSLLLCWLSLVQQVGATHCGGFSGCGVRALGMWASVVVECGLSSCGTRA